MTIYRIHPDRLVYQLLSISADEVEEKLGEESLFHMDHRPKPYADCWKTLEVSFYDSTSGKKKLLLPDITIDHGRLFLNQKSCDALFKLIENDAELLPVKYSGKNGVIVNPLKIAENFEALNQKCSIKNEWGDLQALDFYEDKLTGTCIFRSKYEGYFGIFCNEDFKSAVESQDLKGITFGEDLGNIFPPDPSAQSPVSH